LTWKKKSGSVSRLSTITPAWRQVGPPPALGRDEIKKEWDEVQAEHRDRKDEEHRAARVLEERESRA
jgi:hypothetical protein